MDIEKILKAGETERVEFKKSFGKETIISLVAFANSRGGRVVVGIDDNGRIRGFPCGPETVQQCFNEIKVSTYPQLSPSIDIHEFQGKALLLLEINEYPIKPVAYKNRYCKRVGIGSHALALNEIVELQQQCLNLSFDAYPLEEDLSSLDHDTMVRFFERVNGIGRANLRDDPPRKPDKAENHKRRKAYPCRHASFRQSRLFHPLGPVQISRNDHRRPDAQRTFARGHRRGHDFHPEAYHSMIKFFSARQLEMHVIPGVA